MEARRRFARCARRAFAHAERTLRELALLARFRAMRGRRLRERAGIAGHEHGGDERAAEPEKSVGRSVQEVTGSSTTTGIYPPYEDYQNRTKREIPVVVLEPVTS